LSSEQVYRAALPVDTAVDIMIREREGLFDPELLDLFLERLDHVLAISGTLTDPPAPRITRIVVVDQERVVVDGLVQIIHHRDEMRVIGTANSLAEAVQVLDELRPDVILSAFLLPDGDGARLSEHVLAHRPETKILILTSMATPEVALRCISAGCSGLVAKTATGDEVTSAIRRVHDGEVVIPPTLLPNVVSGLRRSPRTIGDDIAPREREVLGHLAHGLSLPDIAANMSISMNTARNHTQRVIEKLGAHSKLEAVVIAVREKVIELN
jgi:DNA-binding NarL/FixJ family response regulator